LATSTDPGPARARLVLALLAVLPYAPSLGQPFFADDYIHLERARALPGAPWSLLAEAWVLRAADAAAWWSPPELAVPYFRPLVTLSFLLDSTVWGLRPAGFHLTNVLLHLATTLIAYGIARRVLATPAAAFVAAALFALHPCHAEAVLWVSARTDLMAGAAAAAAVLFYMKAREGGGLRPGATLAGLAALTLGLLAKETAACVPALWLLYEALVPGTGPRRRRLAGPLLALGVVAAYAVLRARALGAAALPPHPFAHGPGDPDLPAHALMAPFLYLADLTLFVPPDPVVTLPWWRAHPLAFAALALVSVLVFASSLRAVPERRTRWLGLGWIALALLPAALLSVGERFLYLPSLGYCLLRGAGAGARLATLGESARRPLLAMGVVVAAVALARTVGFGVLAGRSRQVVDDALAALEASPDRSLALIVDLPAAAALGFGHALRLERPAPLEVEVLSVAPGFLTGSAASPSEVTGTAGAFALRRSPPYLQSYVEHAFLGERRAFAIGDVVVRPSFTVAVRDTTEGGVSAFEVRLRPEALPRSLLLRGRGFRLRADPALP
jgi:hypothetical protein